MDTNTSDKQTTVQIQTAMCEYIKTMDDKTRKAYEIAQHHLESSFDLEKSIGFQTFLKTYMKQTDK
jgi:hypothetical protein